MTFKERLKASIEREEEFRDSLTYWREMLAGAVEDEQASWNTLNQSINEFTKAKDRWREDWNKRREVAERVRRLEEERLG